MTNARIETKITTETRVVEVPVDTVILEMTLEEAKALASLCGKVRYGGVTHPIFETLTRLDGVAHCGNDYRVTEYSDGQHTKAVGVLYLESK